MKCCDRDEGCATPSQPPTSAPGSAASAHSLFVIQKMDCPTEEKLIRDKLGGMEGIAALQFNLMQRELTVHHSLPSTSPIMSALQELDLDAVVKSAGTPTEVPGYTVPWQKWALMAVSGVTAIGSELIAWTTGSDSSWPVIALAVMAILTGGLDTLRKGWIAVRHFSLNMNFLMSVAVIGAVLIGQWPEAAVVIFLFAAAEMIEALSLDRARNAIQSLMAMTPDLATVRGEDGQWQQVPAVSVQPGTLARVRPGERIALDGVVTKGQTSINQAPITGESMPIVKEPGAHIFAGTINERGEIEYKVTAAQGESTLARIVRSVQQAQGERAPTQRFVDQFARYYIPIVVLAALAVGLVMPLALGAAFTPWVYKALVLLVIACPCALVISTPVAVVSGLAAAARAGILVKGGVYLELGRKLKVIALDKTGTVTIGKPSVTDTLVLSGTEADALLVTASLSSRSDHPVSTAVATHWLQLGSTSSLLEVHDFEAMPGRGVKGTIAGQAYFLGNHRLVHEMGICSDELEAKLDAFESLGKTAVILATARAPLMVLVVADTIRTTSAQAIADIRSMGVAVVMLSGDNRHTASAIGAMVGITEAHGDLLPEDKLAIVAQLGGKYGRVGMVGDGVNDAPALAKSDIGFAMGAAGTDTALETADVALMDDDLGKLPAFLRLSHRTSAILKQNVAVALGIKAVFLVLALGGHATLWMAVFADMGASLLVVFNSLRLLRPVTSPAVASSQDAARSGEV